MKHILILFFLLSWIPFFACKQDKPNRGNMEQIKKQLDGSPNVAKYRAAFNSHTIHLASYTPDELKLIHDQMRKCGLHSGQGNLENLKQCLVNIPNKDEYIESEFHLREFEALEKNVSNEFPEIWELDPKARAELLFPPGSIGDDEIQELLSKGTKTVK